MVDLSDPAVRERLAERAYYRSKMALAAVAAEHDTAPADYFTLSWQSLSDDARRPFRAGVDETCDVLAAAA